MKTNNKIIIILCVLVGLSACSTVNRANASHDNDYLKQANTVAPPKMPSNLSMSQTQSYYPIPPANTSAAAAPAIVPPGSVLMQRQMQPQAAAPATRTSAVIASSSNAFVLNVPYDVAWGQVGRALATSGYKVMQQDKNIGTYFILDLAGTGGQLKTNTPIYQLHLKPSANTTAVTLFDDKGNPANVGVGARIMGALKQKL